MKPLNRHQARRRGIATFAVAALVVATATACSQSTEEEPSSGDTSTEVPDYYPDDYDTIIDAARAEGGELVIYSSLDEANWAPIIDAFQEKYPFVDRIQALNLNSDEIFQRQLSEQAAGNAPADLLVSNSVQAWTTFADQGDYILDYESPEIGQLPELAVSMPGVYALSVDPQVLGYNTSLISDGIDSFADLATLIAEDPGAYQNMVGVREISSSFAFTVFYNLLEAKPELWDHFEQILPISRPENSSGTVAEKVLSGEEVAGVLISIGPAVTVRASGNGLFEFALPTDGTLVLSMSSGIASSAPHPNTAKLFTDFFLSHEGQQAVLDGGLTAYRDGLDPVEGSYTLEDVEEIAGDDAVVTVQYEQISEEDVAAFAERWNGLLG